MRTRAPGADLTMVRLDSASGVPLYRQLSEEVRRAISDGTLVAGARLPATRVLMKDLDVSRNTVLAAFRQLIADGHLSAKRGSGVYVAGRAQGPPSPQAAEINNSPGSWSTPVQKLPATSPQTSSPLPARLGESTCLPQRTSTLAQLPLSKLYRPRPLRPVCTGALDWREFPLDIWERLRARALRESGAAVLNCGDPAGYLPLRQALALYLSAQCARYPLRRGPNRRHGWSTTGPTFNLIGSVLVSPGDVVAIEEP